MANGYRTHEQIRAEADCEYQVYWRDVLGNHHMDKIIANDHEDAKHQLHNKVECDEVLLIMKGDILILWQA